MIAEFYENCEIFMTGGSGVVGKAAIEKLLRSCNVKKIYILLRSKRGVSHERRLEELKNSRIFKVLKESKPNELDKLVAIPGDIAEEGLGISPEHLDQIKNVSVFFHSAASTRFTEPLKTAIRLNLKSTYEALKTAETMKCLKIFLHISTYFSNPDVSFIEDKVYPTVFDWRTALKIADLEDNDPILEIFTTKVITGFPNTYIFTKHLAEKLVDDHRSKLPVAIYKPSVVIAAVEEPEVGFTETLTGVMGMMAVWGTGFVQSVLLSDKNAILDTTPLDLGTKTLLMFTALRAKLPRERLLETTQVGKFSSIHMANAPLSVYLNLLTKAVHLYPLEKAFWIPNATVTTCPFVYWIMVILLQLIPAMLFDNLLKIFGYKPFMMAIQRKMFLTRNALIFFLDNESRSDGITDYDEMLKFAKGTEFDISFIEEITNSKDITVQCVYDNIRGCRKYLLNEPDSSIEKCKKILKAKVIVYNILRGIVGFYIIRCLYQRITNSYFSQEL